MKLWLLRRQRCTDWEAILGLVVRAKTEKDARRIASRRDPSTFDGWITGKNTTCKVLTAKGRAQMIMVDWLLA